MTMPEIKGEGKCHLTQYQNIWWREPCIVNQKYMVKSIDNYYVVFTITIVIISPFLLFKYKESSDGLTTCPGSHI